MIMTKTELFLQLAQPDQNGCSRWINTSEFVGEYTELKFGNGASWARKESTLAKKYKKAPLVIANDVAAMLTDSEIFKEVSAVAPGFLNCKVNETFVTEYLQGMADCLFHFEAPKGRPFQNHLAQHQ